jgi:hypothetical protein
VLCRGTADHIAHVRAWGAQPVAGDRRDDGVLERDDARTVTLTGRPHSDVSPARLTLRRRRRRT